VEDSSTDSDESKVLLGVLAGGDVEGKKVEGKKVEGKKWREKRIRLPRIEPHNASQGREKANGRFSNC
jgi:hypothetical protein